MRPLCALLLMMTLSGACAFDPPGLMAPEPTPDAGPGDMPSDQTALEDLPADMAPEDAPTDQDAGGPDVPPDAPADLPVDLAQDMTTDADQDAGPPDLPVMLGMCEGEEVDLLSDPSHCGQCGVGCDPKFGVCERGRCGCTEAGYMACGERRRCEDTTRDPSHCGQCGFGCGPGAMCEGSQCVCRPGLTLCGGACVDMSADPAHCGMCDRSCQGNACRAGSCKNNDQCEFGEGRCTRDGGVACLSRFGERNDLYCRRNLTFGCGETCGGAEICVDPGVLSPRACYESRLGRGCTACPCEDCGGDDRCEEALGVVLCYDP